MKPNGVRFTEPGRECVVPPQPLGLMLARRYADQERTRTRRYGMTRSYSSCMDLLDLLRAGQRAHAGDRAVGVAMSGAAMAEQRRTDPRNYLPDLYVSLDYHAHGTTRGVPMQGREDAWVLQPDGFRAAVTQWVGVDIDGIQGWPTDGRLVEAAVAVQAVLERHPQFSGRMGLTRTGSQGVQVVAQLADARWCPADFYADPHVQRMLAGMDAVVLRALHDHGVLGGYADPTVHAPGRLVRRPGPRVDKTGSPTVARLVWATA